MNDLKIIEGLIDKDSDTLDVLLLKYNKLIYGVINSVLNLSHERFDIDECFNDIILTIWYNASKYDANKGNLDSWIASISKFKAIDYKRKSNKKYNQKNVDEVILEEIENTEALILNSEKKEYLEKAIDILNPIDRRIFKMRFLEDKDIKSISKELGISADNIYTKISRGKKKIKCFMEENYE